MLFLAYNFSDSKKEHTRKGPGRPPHNAHPQTCSGDPIPPEELEKRERERKERKLRKQLEKQQKKLAAKGIHVDIDSLKKEIRETADSEIDVVGGVDEPQDLSVVKTMINPFSIENLLRKDTFSRRPPNLSPLWMDSNSRVPPSTVPPSTSRPSSSMSDSSTSSFNSPPGLLRIKEELPDRFLHARALLSELSKRASCPSSAPSLLACPRQDSPPISPSDVPLRPRSS